MVFGLNEKQSHILGYLYELKDGPQTPPDYRRSVSSMAKNLGMTQKEIRDEAKGLEKRRYVTYVLIERERHYSILPGGVHEVEKYDLKTTEVEVSSEKIGIKRKKSEEV